MAVVDVPLLFENRRRLGRCDAIVVVIVDAAEVQRKPRPRPLRG
jgi:dephospho-CoA kinase